MTVHRQRRILLVDDNHDAVDAMRTLLQMRGAEVQVAYDGAAALEAAAWFNPDVAILDIDLPGMDGYEVARRIQERPGSGKCALIALTGWGQEIDRRHVEAAGFGHHLVKPASIDDIQATLDALDR